MHLLFKADAFLCSATSGRMDGAAGDGERN